MAKADRWVKPPLADEQPEVGYAEWLTSEIAEGLAELDSGTGILAEQVWKDLGLE